MITDDIEYVIEILTRAKDNNDCEPISEAIDILTALLYQQTGQESGYDFDGSHHYD